PTNLPIRPSPPRWRPVVRLSAAGEGLFTVHSKHPQVLFTGKTHGAVIFLSSNCFYYTIFLIVRKNMSSAARIGQADAG
ncbi:hypothetical protein, partial [Thetidibacter halocola]